LSHAVVDIPSVPGVSTGVVVPFVVALAAFSIHEVVGIFAVAGVLILLTSTLLLVLPLLLAS
jgi:hypothetical protein